MTITLRVTLRLTSDGAVVYETSAEENPEQQEEESAYARPLPVRASDEILPAGSSVIAPGMSMPIGA